jgi:hypothetical protein
MKIQCMYLNFTIIVMITSFSFAIKYTPNKPSQSRAASTNFSNYLAAIVGKVRNVLLDRTNIVLNHMTQFIELSSSIRRI